LFGIANTLQNSLETFDWKGLSNKELDLVLQEAGKIRVASNNEIEKRKNEGKPIDVFEEKIKLLQWLEQEITEIKANRQSE